MFRRLTTCISTAIYSVNPARWWSGRNAGGGDFPTISRKDLMVTGQSARVPVVFQLKDCKGPAEYEVRVTLTGTEDSEQPGFLALDASSEAQGVGIGMEKPTEHRC